MKLFAIFALILVAVSATSLYDKYPINFSQKRSIMTLLTQVEAQLKAGGPMDAITRILGDFRTEIVTEQVQHDELWASQQVECQGEFEFRESEVKAAVAAFNEATETLDGCNSQRNRAEGDLKITKKQLMAARSLLALAVDTRRREAYAFETASTAFNMGSRAVGEALNILEEIWSDNASFMQLNSHVNGMLKTAVKVRKAHLLAGVMTALSQLGNKDVQADEDLLNRIKTLLTNFKAKLDAEFQSAVAAEEAAQAAYAEEKQRLETMIDQLIAQQVGLEAEIAALKKCQITQSGIVSSAASKRDRNQRIWNDAIELCDAVEAEYHSSTEARDEELELLAAINERVEARFGEVSSGVTKRGETDEEDFAYSNVTEYDNTGFVSESGRKLGKDISKEIRQDHD